MNQETIFIAVPVFNGKDFLPETLRSIRDQTFVDFRVLISIDNNDLESARACQEFLDDQRFEMIIQSQHFGWARHFNWMIEQCHCPFFIYWQQDDFATTNYLEELYKELITHESASVAYTDVQWFGSKFERESSPSILGNVYERLWQSIEQISYIPLRGLIRTDVLRECNPIQRTNIKSSHNEFPFLVELAALGEFRRSAHALYFKRAHQENTFIKWINWEPWQKRRSWIEMGLDFYQLSKKYLPANFLKSATIFILDRLAIQKPGRAFFYLPSPDGLQEFVSDFLNLGNLENPLTGLDRLETIDLNPFDKPIHEDLQNALNDFESIDKQKSELFRELDSNNEFTASVSKDGNGLFMLGLGWSMRESWGVWTDGEEATIILPIKKSGKYELNLYGYHYSSQACNRALVGLSWRVHSDHTYQKVQLTPGIDASIKFEFDYQFDPDNIPCRIELHLPDSFFLPDDGIEDYRRVGFGLKSIKLAKVYQG